MINYLTKSYIHKKYKQVIESSFPSNWETDIIDINLLNNFEVFLRINAETIEDVEKWITTFQTKTNTAYYVETAFKCSGQRIRFKKSYHCHHRIRHKLTHDPVFRKSIANTNCPSMLLVTLRTVLRRYQGKDKSKAPNQKKPCEIRVRLKHNHSKHNFMALRFKKVLPETKAQLLQLFHQGHNSRTALKSLKNHIILHNKKYMHILNDKSKCPTYPFCHYYYHKMFKSLSKTLKFDADFLKKKINEYNTFNNDVSARIHVTNNEYVVCICPPLVKRIHQHLPSSGQTLFMDSIPMNDINDARIFILLTQSEIGGLPLGVFLVSSYNINLIKIGLTQLKDLLGSVAFFGNVDGPQCTFTDENIVNSQIIKSLWPKSTNFICNFHVLENIWKWLFKCKNLIEPSDRINLLIDFYKMTYATTESQFVVKFGIAKRNASKYINYLNLLDTYFNKRYSWALCYRLKLCKKYSETIFRVLRERIFQCLGVFNFVQSIDYIMNNFFFYFKNNLLNAASNNKINNYFQRNKFVPEYVSSKVLTLGDHIYLVAHKRLKNYFYLVNMDILMCTCFNGYANSICKHVKCIFIQNYSNEVKKIKNIELKKIYYLIATGNVRPENMLSDHLKQKRTKHEIDLNSSMEIEVTRVYIESNLMSTEDRIKICNEKWQQITAKIDELRNKNPKELVPAMNILFSRFNKVKTVADLCSAFGIFSDRIN